MFVKGPLRTVAIEHHLPTQADHGWQGSRVNTSSTLLPGASLTHSSGVSSAKADQVAPSSEVDSLPPRGVASPLGVATKKR